MRVVVAEKPSVARDLARVLGARGRGEGCLTGDGLAITWCFGHMAELVDPGDYRDDWKRWSPDTLPMVPEAFRLRLRGGDVGAHWKHLKRLLREADELVNACDAGREGELIFRYATELAGVRKPVLRFWTSSLTDAAIRSAWVRLQPGSAFDALGAAARSRSEADWLVGLNATRAMTCLARKGGGGQLLSVGRVQTPTLAMIVRRDREIEAFVPEDFWRVRGRFTAEGGALDAVWTREDGRTAPLEGRPPRGDRRDAEEAPHAERLDAEAKAEAVARAAEGQPGVVRSARRKETRERPPLLYDLTALQRRANQRYGLSAKRTLEIAQALYERHKLLTYPRTDARFLTPDQVPGLPDVVRAVGRVGVYAAHAEALLQRPIQPGKRVVDASEVGDHHAILPTDRAPDPGRLSADEKRIYDLVARRLLAALSADARFAVAELLIDVTPREGAPLPDEVSAPLVFRARGKVCLDPGWQAIDPPARRKDRVLPDLEEGASVQTAATEVLPGQTRPPRPHTDASILKGMETAGRELDDAALKRALRSAGLGTPATRAAILQTLLNRKFIERKGKALSATPRGRALIDAVPVDALKSAELTGRWEKRLADVAEGRADRGRFMADVVADLQATVEAILAAEPPPPEPGALQASPPLGTCPLCEQPVRERKTVYSCDSGRSCPLVIPKKLAKRDLSKRTALQLLTEGRTPVLKRFKSKKGKLFEAALVLGDDGRITFDFPPRGGGAPGKARPKRPASPAPPPPPAVGAPCPACGVGRVIRGRTAVGCSQWRAGCGWRGPLPG